jgi:hypothetical protein
MILIVRGHINGEPATMTCCEPPRCPHPLWPGSPQPPTAAGRVSGGICGHVRLGSDLRWRHRARRTESFPHQHREDCTDIWSIAVGAISGSLGFPSVIAIPVFSAYRVPNTHLPSRNEPNRPGRTPMAATGGSEVGLRLRCARSTA